MAGQRRDLRSVDSQHDPFDGTSFGDSLLDSPAGGTPNDLESIETSSIVPPPTPTFTAWRANGSRGDWETLGTSVNPILVDDDRNDRRSSTPRSMRVSRSRAEGDSPNRLTDLQQALYKVERRLRKEKKTTGRLRGVLNHEAASFQQQKQQQKLLYDRERHFIFLSLRSEATQRAKLVEDHRRFSAIQKERYLSRERKLKAELEVAKSAERQLREQQLRERQVHQCSICYERICDTVTKCGHQFCWECFVSWHRKQALSEGPHTCPFCRTALGSTVDSATSMVIKLHRN